MGVVTVLCSPYQVPFVFVIILLTVCCFLLMCAIMSILFRLSHLCCYDLKWLNSLFPFFICLRSFKPLLFHILSVLLSFMSLFWCVGLTIHQTPIHRKSGFVFSIKWQTAVVLVSKNITVCRIGSCRGALSDKRRRKQKLKIVVGVSIKIKPSSLVGRSLHVRGRKAMTNYSMRWSLYQNNIIVFRSIAI